MMFKRRHEKKTDYNQRLALLKSGKTRFVVRRSLNNIHVQVVQYERSGDIVLVEVISKELRNHGWRAHCGNLPSAYLTGLIAGLKAKKEGIKEAVADIGLQSSTKNNSLYACLAGAKDAGLSIPLGKDILPDSKHISGKHIADYANLLKGDQKKYARQFSSYIKNKFDPEKLPEHFEEVKGKILKEYGVEDKSREVVTAGGFSDTSEPDDGEWDDVTEERT